jgi:uncharacterized protein YxjI
MKLSFKKFKIKEKVWSLRQDYRILDENDNLLYRTDGSKFSFKNKTVLLDASGEEIVRIEKKLLTMRPTYLIIKEGQPLFKIVKRFTLKPRIIVESLTDSDAFLVEGNLWGNEYRFVANDEEFAFVSKDIWKLADTYGIAMHPDSREDINLAVILIIDMIKDEQEQAA